MASVRTLRLAGLAAVATLVIAGPGRAQSAQRLSAQVSPIFVGAFGKAYDGLTVGGGLEAQIRYTPSAWSFGAGIQASGHGIEDEAGVLDDGAAVLAGVFFEPRRVIDVGSSTVAPYVSGRVAILAQVWDITLLGENFTGTAVGGQLNAGGGLLFRVGRRVNLDLGATFGVIQFGDVEIDSDTFGSETVEGTSGTGQNVVIRAGVSIGIGR